MTVICIRFASYFSSSKISAYQLLILRIGPSHHELDSLEKAFEHFDILIKIESQNHLGYYYRAISNMFSGKTEQAKQDLKQALVFNAGFEKAKIALEELNNN